MYSHLTRVGITFLYRVAQLVLPIPISQRTRPLDFDSLAALHTLDKLFADSAVSTVILEEMLPNPDQSPIRDTDHERLATQLLINLSCHATPTYC